MLGLAPQKRQKARCAIEFNAAAAKFKNGSTWKVNKITLAKTDANFFGLSYKVAIDLSAPNFQPVLQSTVKMPKQATPPEDLHTLLKCIPGQVVDVIVFATKCE